MNRELIVFKEMYLSYLGIEVARPYNKRITIAITKKREQVRNEIFRYPMIIIEMKKGFFISTSEQAFKEYKFWDRRTRLPKHLKELFYYLKAFYPEKSIRFMNRMIMPRVWEDTLIYMPTLRVLFECEGMRIDAKVEGKFIGYCKVSDRDGEFGNIAIYVEPSYRQQMVGTQLLQQLLKIMKQENIRPQYWVDESNIASVSLAKKCGFVPVADEIVIGGTIDQY